MSDSKVTIDMNTGVVIVSYDAMEVVGITEDIPATNAQVALIAKTVNDTVRCREHLRAA